MKEERAMAKRMVSLLLVLAMSFSLLSVTAWAEESDIVADVSMEMTDIAAYSDAEDDYEEPDETKNQLLSERPTPEERYEEPEEPSIAPQSYYNDYAVAVGCQIQLNMEEDCVGEWVSDNPDIATVDENGVVTGIALGEATITFTGHDAYEYFSEDSYVTVTAPKLSASALSLNLYGAYQYSDGTYDVENGYLSLSGLCYDSDIQVTSSSSDLVVDYYHWDDECWIELYPKKSGTFTVTITADGKVMKCTVSVFNASFVRNSKSCGDGNSKKWDPYSTALALYTGESTTLSLSGVPSSVKPKWSTSNSNVAAVNSKGVVTAKGLGQAVITVTLGSAKLNYPVSVSYKTAVNALRNCIKTYHSTYSQSKRMSKGYYDCSSYVWRNYKAAGLALGGSKSYAPTAADLAKWCVKNGYMVYEGTVNVADLLPGDLVFETGEKNGRYKGIYHVDMAQGNGKLITVARTKSYSGTLSKVMVARPCGTQAGALKASKQDKAATKLTWGTVYKATGYQVYRSTKKKSGFKKLANAKGTSYSAKTNHKKTYYYKVRPYWTKNGKTYYGRYSAVVKAK